MINIAKAAMGLVGKQKNPNKDTAVGNVPPHSHDNSKNNNTMNPIGNITGNLNNNLKVQELGANLFQGEALAEQEMAKRNLGKPVMPLSPDPMGDQYGMQFNQPFAQKKLTVHPVPQQPQMEFVKPTREMTGLQREIPIKKPTKRIYKEMVEKVPKMTGHMQVEQRMHKHEEKMEKSREMPKKVIPPTNLIGGIKKPKDPNKGKAYVVNKRPNVWQEGTIDRSKDTLWLDNSYKKMAGSLISQDDYDASAKIAHSKGSYKRVGVQDLEDLGEIKIKK